jgi:hypothetical protein
MRRVDAGRGYAKTIFTLLVLALVVYAGVQVVPAYINNYQLNDYLRSQTPFWLAQHSSSEMVQKAILAKAQDLNLPISAEQIKVEVTGSRVAVAIDYTVPIDLKLYTWALHFTPGAESRSL